MRRRPWLLTTLWLLAACGAPTPTEPTPSDDPFGGLPPIETPPIPQDVSPAISSMLERLAAKIVFSYHENQQLRARNPSHAAFYDQKLAMLTTPGLIDQIFDHRRWVEGEAASVHGVTPIGAVFPLESMRGECAHAVLVLEQSLPILAEFMGEPFPSTWLELWYGFTMGSGGGSGRINLTDRTTWAVANPGSIPYEAIIAHEAAHSYMSNEALTQFLELYVYNTRLGLGTDPLNWERTRGWSPTTPSPFGVNGVMDIYVVVGHDAMQRAYRAIAPLRPAYGRPLTDAVIAAFVAQVPEEHRAFVEERLRTIIA
jgi:hypothetical protein